jgi:hypothetical protein
LVLIKQPARRLIKAMINKNVSHKILAITIIGAAIIVGLATDTFASRLPDTLRFGSLTYLKRVERMYNNRARLVLINENEQPPYVMAELFDRFVSFSNLSGKTIKTDSFPQPPSFAYSKTGRWLYIWGRKDYTNNFYRLYGPRGVVLFEKVMPSSGTEPATGMPTETGGNFIKEVWPEGLLEIVDSTGIAQHSVKPLTEDVQADFLYDSDLGEKNIFLVASPGEYTELVCYNSDLVEQRRQRVSFTSAVALTASRNGRFAMVNFFDVGEGRPILIITPSLDIPYKVSYPLVGRFSYDENYFGTARINGEVLLLRTDSWEPIVKIDSTALISRPSAGNWKDIEFSDDGRFMFGLSDGIMLVVDIEKRTWEFIDFPYNFRQARLFKQSIDLYFTGDYGWVLYRLSR